jgi:hypothetical protein
MTDTVLERSGCPNCNAPLSGSYCARCGQKVASIDPSLHEVLHDLTHELLHVDGKIFRSLQLLITRPGYLTLEYVLGRRARYVSPIRLYLIFSVLYFGFSALDANRIVFQADEAIEVSDLGRALGLGTMTPAEANQLVNDAQTHWVPRAMFLLVPICALLVQVVTRRSGKNYPQHLYFALHGHAAYFAMLSLVAGLELAHVGALSAVLSVLGTIFPIVYTVVAFRTTYGGRWLLAAGRTAFVLTSYMLIVGVALVTAVLSVVKLH